MKILNLCICFVISYTFASEPSCSKFSYEESLLEKMIRTEIKFEQFKESVEMYLENYDKAKLARKKGLEYVAKNLSIHSRVEVLTDIYKGL